MRGAMDALINIPLMRTLDPLYYDTRLPPSPLLPEVNWDEDWRGVELWSRQPSGLILRQRLPLLVINHAPILASKLPLLTPGNEDDGDWRRLKSGLYGKQEPGRSFVPPLWFSGPAWQQRLASMFSAWFGPSLGESRPKRAEPEHDRSRTLPFLGWKTLAIVVTKRGELKVEGAASTYGIDSHAVCTATHFTPEKHKAPQWDCTCGFYALADKPDHPEYGQFIARVELFGTVIEAQRGWRAGRQRVLSLEVFRECRFERPDDSEPCGKPADGFGVDSDGEVYPVCAMHAPLGFATLADLRARLGTEVRWAA